MKKVLVIGSAVVDVILYVDHLPRTQEDVHVLNQEMSLGGCAYNTSDMIRQFGVPCLLFAPVGSGAYGDFVRSQFAARNVSSPIPSPAQENGCCYCFVESGGERTFASWHGAEYRFQKEWFQIPDPSSIDSVYICGLEIEETTGPVIVEYLEEHSEYRIYFAPGPRFSRIDSSLPDRLFRLHPVLHLNEEEVFHHPDCQKCGSLEEAAKILHSLTRSDVIVTLGPKGAYYQSAGDAGFIPGFPAKQIDTIGAGDSHIGAVIACEKLGMSLPDAIKTANRVAARVVETRGALLDHADFAALHLL